MGTKRRASKRYYSSATPAFEALASSGPAASDARSQYPIGAHATRKKSNTTP